MAASTLKVLEIKRFDTLYEETSNHLVALDTTDGGVLAVNTARDEKYLIKVVNTTDPSTGANRDLTIVAGDHGVVSQTDLKIATVKGKTYWIQVNSAKFKKLQNPNGGTITFKTSGAGISVAAYRLP